MSSIVLEKKRQGRIIPLFFGGIALVIGLWLIDLGAAPALTVVNTSNWPSTNATILESSMKPCAQNGQADCHPKVKFEYSVDSKVYTGNVIDPVSDRGYSADSARDLLGRFGPGKKVTVFYNPKEPANSFLIHGKMQRGYPISILLGVAFFLVSVMIVFGVLRERSGRTLTTEVVDTGGQD